MERLDGKTCLITGATGGIGLATAIELARCGAKLVLLCRDVGRGERARAAIEAETRDAEVDLLSGDLASLDQVRVAAQAFLASAKPLHILINNAGIVNLRREETVDGYEATFAVNHLAHFLLTNLLLERMIESAPSRIVNVSSDAHRGVGAFDFDNVDGRKSYGVMRVYGQSKLANLLFTRELARRLEARDVTVNALHPGLVSTRLAANNGWLAKLVWAPLRPFARSPEKGAETSIYLARSTEVAEASGGYYYDCRLHEPRPAALNDADARKLWDLSASLANTAAD